MELHSAITLTKPLMLLLRNTTPSSILTPDHDVSIDLPSWTDSSDRTETVTTVTTQAQASKARLNTARYFAPFAPNIVT